MINLRKRLSFSVISLIALVFCCLVIGQAVTAKVDHKTSPENDGKINQIAVPLPGQDRGDGGGTAAAIGFEGTAQDARVEWVTPFATEGPEPLVFMKPGQTRPSGGSKDGGQAKSGGDDDVTATVIASLPYSDIDNTTGASNAADEDVGFGLSGAVGDKWYSYTTGAVGEFVDVELCASALWDSKLYVFQAPYTPGVLYAGDDDACDAPSFGRSAVYGVFLAPLTTYFFVVDGWEEAAYQIDVSVGVDPLSCPGGAQIEVELCGQDLNGACNAGDENATQDIVPGDLCGTYWIDGGLGTRDTDWYRYTVTASPGEAVTWSVTGELQTLVGVLTCSDIDGVGVISIANSAGPGANVTFNNFLAPGDYYFYAAPTTGSGTGLCGTAPNPTTEFRYNASLATSTPVPVDDCAAPGTIVDGTNIIDLNDATAGGGLWFGNTPNEWYAYEATCTGTVTITTCAMDPGDYGIAVYDACLEFGGNLIADGDDDCGWENPPGTPLYPELTFVANAGTTYIVEVFSWGVFYANPSPFSEIVTVEVSCEPLVLLGDDCPDAVVLSGEVNNLLMTNEGSNASGPDDCPDVGGDVWIQYTSDCTGEITVCMVGFDAVATAYDGHDCLDVSPRYPIACINGGGGPDCADALDFNGGTIYLDSPAPGTEFLIRLAGWDDGNGNWPEGAFLVSITCDVPLVRPPNNDCADVTPIALVPDGTVSEVGDMTNSTEAGCLVNPPGVWHAFTLDHCADVTMDMCDSFGEFPDSDVNNNSWILDATMFTACPCQDGFGFPDNSAFIACDGEATVNSQVWLGLTPGTYYLYLADVYGVSTGGNTGGYRVNFHDVELDCGYCIAQHNNALCVAAPPEHITNFTVAAINNNTGCGGDPDEAGGPGVDIPGYADYTQDGPVGSGLVTGGDVFRGLTYDFSVTVANPHADDVVLIWIDWNQDFDLGLFAPAELVFQGPSGASNVAGQFTVPFDAVLGNTGPSGGTRARLSVIREGDPNGGGLAPCHGEYLFGETEDYLLVVDELICGDFDGDDDRDGADVTFLKDYYFTEGAAPDVAERGDINADCCVNIADIVFLADFVHRGGADPVCIPCQ